MAARLFGIFFILTFFGYGIGSSLVASIANGPGGIAVIFDRHNVIPARWAV